MIAVRRALFMGAVLLLFPRCSRPESGAEPRASSTGVIESSPGSSQEGDHGHETGSAAGSTSGVEATASSGASGDMASTEEGGATGASEQSSGEDSSETAASEDSADGGGDSGDSSDGELPEERWRVVVGTFDEEVNPVGPGDVTVIDVHDDGRIESYLAPEPPNGARWFFKSEKEWRRGTWLGLWLHGSGSKTPDDLVSLNVANLPVNEPRSGIADLEGALSQIIEGQHIRGATYKIVGKVDDEANEQTYFVDYSGGRLRRLRPLWRDAASRVPFPRVWSLTDSPSEDRVLCLGNATGGAERHLYLSRLSWEGERMPISLTDTILESGERVLEVKSVGTGQRTEFVVQIEDAERSLDRVLNLRLDGDELAQATTLITSDNHSDQEIVEVQSLEDGQRHVYAVREGAAALELFAILGDSAEPIAVHPKDWVLGSLDGWRKFHLFATGHVVFERTTMQAENNTTDLYVIHLDNLGKQEPVPLFAGQPGAFEKPYVWISRPGLGHMATVAAQLESGLTRVFEFPWDAQFPVQPQLLHPELEPDEELPNAEDLIFADDGRLLVYLPRNRHSGNASYAVVIDELGGHHKVDFGGAYGILNEVSADQRWLLYSTTMRGHPLGSGRAWLLDLENPESPPVALTDPTHPLNFLPTFVGRHGM